MNLRCYKQTFFSMFVLYATSLTFSCLFVVLSNKELPIWHQPETRYYIASVLCWFSPGKNIKLINLKGVLLISRFICLPLAPLLFYLRSKNVAWERMAPRTLNLILVKISLQLYFQVFLYFILDGLFTSMSVG